MLVAGGGGGAGGTAGSNGEPGGDAGAMGGGAFGGGNGTVSAGGAGGGDDGTPGVFGAGGTSTGLNDGAGGGGGGGGYFGGGGGQTGTMPDLNIPDHVPGYGGGGGSSYSAGTGTPSLTTASASVAITPGPTAPAALLHPASLSFASTAIGTIGLAQHVTVTNGGDLPLHVGAVTTDGPQSSDFVTSGSTCTQPLPTGASCAVAVRFAPSGRGLRTATLHVASDDPSSPAAAALAGEGTTATGPAAKPPTTKQILAVLFAALRPGGRGAGIAAILAAGGYRATVRLPEAGREQIRWYEVPKGAHLARAARRKPVLVASGSKRVTKAQRATLRLRLSRAGRALLKKVGRGHRITLAAEGTFTPRRGRSLTKRRTFRLRR